MEVVLREAAEDLLAFTAFQVSRWKKIWSTNPLERLNKGNQTPHQRRRVYPNPDALLRLAGAVLVEAHDEWQIGDRRYLSEGSMTFLTEPCQPRRLNSSPHSSPALSDPQSTGG